MRLIGLTGSIASGKSTVSNRLKELGAYVINADAVSHEVTASGSEGLRRIEAEFGSDVINESGTLDRKRIAALVFADNGRLQALNSILHPIIMENMRVSTREISARDDKAVVVWDVPLLLEIGAHNEVDEVWLVIADDTLRLERAMKRDGATRQSVEARMAAQMPQSEKERYADKIIVNNGSVQELVIKVDALFKAIWENR